MNDRRNLSPEEAGSLFSIKSKERKAAQEQPPTPQDLLDKEFWTEMAQVLDALEKIPGNRWKVYRVRGSFRWLFRQLEAR